MQHPLRIAFIAAAITASCALGAYAAQPEQNDALLTRLARISLLQAVQTAEGQLHGRAVRAELEDGHQGWIYDVEVVAKGKVYDVAIDATTGNVLNQAVDLADNDDAGDARD